MNSADIIYADMLVANAASSTTAPPQLKFSETRSSPILTRSEDYELSVVRFTVDSTQATVPVLIPLIQVGQSDPDLTVYSVTLQYTYNGFDYISQSFVQWSPQDASAPVPLGPSQTGSGLQDIFSSTYYYCFSYNYFTYLVFIAIRTAYTDLVGQVTAAGGSLPTADNCPFITWDSTANGPVLFSPYPYYDLGEGGGGNPILMFLNAELYSLFQFPARHNGYNVTYGRQFQILTAAVGSTNTIPLYEADDPTHVGEATSYIQTYPEFSPISSWSPFVAIVFTSAHLPVVPSLQSQPSVFINQQLITSGQPNNTASVITDLATADQTFSPFINYTPTSEYRMISLTGSNPLFTIDVSVSWRLKTGAIIPMYLPAVGSCSLKIMFRKKKK